ncbi:MAG TPA: SRPBCC family protein [Pyrinomonadaceae bacterium]|nr:SRPBCC family protein [Pyrinomonadaceae bacterium]
MASTESSLTNDVQAASLTGGGGTGTQTSGDGGVTMPNVGQTERWVSTIGGGALALYGITRGSLGGIALALVGAALIQRGYTGHCALYESIGYSSTGDKGLRNSENVSVPGERGIKLEKSVTVNRPAAELYSFWRNFENLPRFMNHLEAVHVTGAGRSHWVAKAPAGTTVEWDAEVYNEKENELIAWRTLEGADVASAGSVHFEPAQGGAATTVRVVLKYDPPGGAVGAAVARLFGENPEQQIDEDLRRFKQIMEGAQSAGSEASGRGASA